MKIKMIVAVILLIAALAGLATYALHGDCCSVAELCCCEEVKGKQLSEFNCTCVGGVLQTKSCKYITVWSYKIINRPGVALDATPGRALRASPPDTLHRTNTNV